jgi:hypothetical protein
LPANEIRHFNGDMSDVVEGKARAGRHQLVAFQLFYTEKATLHIAAHRYSDMISERYMSYERFSYPSEDFFEHSLFYFIPTSNSGLI